MLNRVLLLPKNQESETMKVLFIQRIEELCNDYSMFNQLCFCDGMIKLTLSRFFSMKTTKSTSAHVPTYRRE